MTSRTTVLLPMNICATDPQETLAEQTTVKHFKGRTRRKAKHLPPQNPNQSKRSPACKNHFEMHASSGDKVFIRNIAGN